MTHQKLSEEVFEALKVLANFFDTEPEANFLLSPYNLHEERLLVIKHGDYYKELDNAKREGKREERELIVETLWSMDTEQVWKWIKLQHSLITPTKTENV